MNTQDQNRMVQANAFREYYDWLRDFMSRATAGFARAPEANERELDREFGELALALFRRQFEQVEPFRAFCEAQRAHPGTVEHWTAIPAVTTRAFKEFEFTSLTPAQRTKVFCSSGTARQTPSRHFHDADSLALYETSVWGWFQPHLLSDLTRIEAAESETASDPLRLVLLTPPPEVAPSSSLVHMLASVSRRFGQATVWTGALDGEGGWLVDFEQTLGVLREAEEQSRPVVLLGTAFSFVHLLDYLHAHDLQFSLPPGSRVMETGGYKRRSRTLAKHKLHAWIAHQLGVPSARIVCEYGMCELSSQAYDWQIEPPPAALHGLAWHGRPARDLGHLGQDAQATRAGVERVFLFPPWARARVISPETGREVADGETGLIRVIDLANVRSVLAIQTEDLAVRRGDGFELIGRAELAEPRGCSLLAA